MKLFLATFVFAISAQAAPVTPYKTPLAFLATRYRAFHTCNCLYVMKMNQDYCINYSKVEPEIFTINIDAANKSVSSGIMGMDFKSSVAKFMNDYIGCSIVNQ